MQYSSSNNSFYNNEGNKATFIKHLILMVWCKVELVITINCKDKQLESGELSGKMLFLRIIENNKIDAFLVQD